MLVDKVEQQRESLGRFIFPDSFCHEASIFPYVMHLVERQRVARNEPTNDIQSHVQERFGVPARVELLKAGGEKVEIFVGEAGAWHGGGVSLAL
jgi:hypothetical protein